MCRLHGWSGAEKGEQKKWRKADTNVVAVRFDHLTKPSNMHTGDAVSCSNCRAIMSHLSTIDDSDTNDKVIMVSTIVALDRPMYSTLCFSTVI